MALAVVLVVRRMSWVRCWLLGLLSLCVLGAWRASGGLRGLRGLRAGSLPSGLLFHSVGTRLAHYRIRGAHTVLPACEGRVP